MTSESILRHTLQSVHLIVFVDMRRWICSLLEINHLTQNRFGIALASKKRRPLRQVGFAPDPKASFQLKQSVKRYRS